MHRISAKMGSLQKKLEDLKGEEKNHIWETFQKIPIWSGN